MKKLEIASNYSEPLLCLGGGKFVNLSVEEGKKLVDKAIELGIGIFDAHHRYGIAEEVISFYPDIVRMTKVSAYRDKDWRVLVNNSKITIGDIDIMWVSDLDDISLYNTGEYIYKELKSEFSNLGITSENPTLLFKFMREHPECNLFMVPFYIGFDSAMSDFIYTVKRQGKKVFIIKPFMDGQLLKKYDIRYCLSYVSSCNPDVILFGTSKIEKLVDTVNIWRTI